jgi:hypothetical protein
MQNKHIDKCKLIPVALIEKYLLKHLSFGLSLRMRRSGRKRQAEAL